MQKLVKESRDELGLSAVNGIKAFSMIFIIAGHALLFMVGGPTLNSDFYAKVNKKCTKMKNQGKKYWKICFFVAGNKICTKCIFVKFTTSC